METKINYVPVTVSEYDGAIVVDCHRGTDRGKPSGPRFWLTRTLRPSGWKLMIHPDDGEPTDCVHIIDRTRQVKILNEDQTWPPSIP